MLAGHNKNLNLLGISTIMGNQTVEKTTDNALKVLKLSGLDHIDVVAGQNKSILGVIATCPEIHGDSGLDTVHGVIPNVQTKGPIKEKAIIHMNRIISQSKTPVTLIATASLTNYALLITVFPEIMKKIDKIIVLGGAIGVGNIGPVMEWNIMVDPHAAKIVFESGLKIVQIPIEVTHTCLVTDSIIKELQSWNTPFSALLVDILMFFAKTYKEVFNFESPPLHDPLAVAYAIQPELFETHFVRVDIETISNLASGQTICDIFHRTGKPKNVHLAVKVDVPKFWDLMIDAFKQSNLKSTLNKPNSKL
jgi:inosine-uridine nucleoside N-ribohydrolase